MSETIALGLTVIGLLAYLLTLLWRARGGKPPTRTRVLFVDTLLVVAALEVVADTLHHLGHATEWLAVLCQGAIVSGGIVLFITRNEGE